MPLSDGLDSIFLNDLPFKIAKEHFTYLGIIITRNPKLLFKMIYLDLLERVGNMIDRWKLLPFSLVVRVNIIKMAVLSKFIYLSENISIFLSSSFFKALDSMVFIWANKPPPISKVHLQKSTADCGLGLPVFCHYYWACSARVWDLWNDTLAGLSDNFNPSWPDIESSNALTLTGASLKALLFSKIKPPIKQLKADFILRNSLKILKQDNNNKSNNNNKFNF